LGAANDWVFANNSAVGLEPVVSIYNIRMTALRGVVRYLVAALRAIMSKPMWTMRIAWDDGEYEGPVSLVSVGNCPITGGLFRMAPAADPADGRLTFVHGYAPTRLRMLALLPRAISGDYVNHRGHLPHPPRPTRHLPAMIPAPSCGRFLPSAAYPSQSPISATHRQMPTSGSACFSLPRSMLCLADMAMRNLPMHRSMTPGLVG
jgi:diacylglycerol kinase (ATP)